MWFISINTVLFIFPTTFFFVLADAATVTDLSASIDSPLTCKLVCSYRGAPRPEVKWLIDKVPMEKDQDKVTMKENHNFESTLIVRNSASVQYQCIVTNNFGEDHSEGTVIKPVISPHSSSKNLSVVYVVHLVVLVFSQI